MDEQTIDDVAQRAEAAGFERFGKGGRHDDGRHWWACTQHGNQRFATVWLDRLAAEWFCVDCLRVHLGERATQVPVGTITGLYGTRAEVTLPGSNPRIKHESPWNVATRLHEAYVRCGHLATEKCEHWTAWVRANAEAIKQDPRQVGLVPVVTLPKGTDYQHARDGVSKALELWAEHGGALLLPAGYTVAWVPKPRPSAAYVDLGERPDGFVPVPDLTQARCACGQELATVTLGRTDRAGRRRCADCAPLPVPPPRAR